MRGWRWSESRPEPEPEMAGGGETTGTGTLSAGPSSARLEAARAGHTDSNHI